MMRFYFIEFGRLDDICDNPFLPDPFVEESEPAFVVMLEMMMAFLVMIMMMKMIPMMLMLMSS